MIITHHLTRLPVYVLLALIRILHIQTVAFRMSAPLFLVFRPLCLLSLLNLIVFHLHLISLLLVVISLICFSKVSKINYLKHKQIKSRKRAFTRVLKMLSRWGLGLMNCTLCSTNFALVLTLKNWLMKLYAKPVLVIKCLPTM